jgi:hypothetical protein
VVQDDRGRDGAKITTAALYIGQEETSEDLRTLLH